MVVSNPVGGRRRLAVVAAWGLVCGAACGAAPAFVCTDSTACEGGACEPTGYCSFPDDDCDSGRRYGQLAGDGLAGMCTEPEATTAAEDDGPVSTGEPSGSGESSSSDGPSLGTTGSSDGADTSTTDPPSTDSGSTGEPACGGLGEACCDDDPPCAEGLCVGGVCVPCELHLAANEFQTCGWRNDGVVACWGNDSMEQLGDGRGTGPSGAPQPVAVVLDPGIVFPRTPLDLGAFHGCAATTDGVQCWGSNEDGQLGQGMPGGTSPDPTGVDAAGGVAAGGFHSCALTEDELRCFGRNTDLQASGVMGPADVPMEVSLDAPIAVATGGFHTCAVIDDGEVQCWGSNTYEQIGAPGLVGPLGVTSVAGLPPVASVTAGDYHTCVVDSEGNVWCWGRNHRGQLGYEDGMGPQGTPQPVMLPAPAQRVVAGDDHNCVLTEDDTLVCFGENADGQIDAALGATLAPTELDLPGAVLDLAAGRSHTCVVVDGSPPSILCWGLNTSGQLGIGSTDDVEGPTPTVFDCAFSP